MDVPEEEEEEVNSFKCFVAREITTGVPCSTTCAAAASGGS